MRTASGRPSLPPSPSVLYVVFTTAQMQHTTTLSPQLPWVKLSFSSYRCRRPGGTMPSSANSATKIAVSTRWNQPYVPFSGQDHVTVCSRARIDARIDRGAITITTMPVPATRKRVRRLPLADAPGGEGPSDEGPSDGPPRRRQRTLDYVLAPSPASSTGSETIEFEITR